MRTRAYLFHTTSVSALKGILRDGRLIPGGGGFVSFSAVPLTSTDISGNDVVLVFSKSSLASQVEEVRYTEPWYIANPEKASYIAGTGWIEQYVEPEECYDDEDWADEDCLEEAYAQAEFDAFFWKSDEQEWISRNEGRNVRFEPKDLKAIQVVRPSEMVRANAVLAQFRDYQRVTIFQKGFQKGMKVAAVKYTIPRDLAVKLKAWGGEDHRSSLFKVIQAGMTNRSIDLATIDNALTELRAKFFRVKNPQLRDLMTDLELIADRYTSQRIAMTRRVVARYRGNHSLHLEKNKQAWDDLKFLIERDDLGETPEAMILLQVFGRGGKLPLVAAEKMVAKLNLAGGPHARRVLEVLEGGIRDAYGYFG